jgi:hypothetical protein
MYGVALHQSHNRCRIEGQLNRDNDGTQKLPLPWNDCKTQKSNAKRCLAQWYGEQPKYLANVHVFHTSWQQSFVFYILEVSTDAVIY